MLTNTTDSITFALSIPGFYSQDTTVNEETYQQLWLQQETRLTDSGFPELPVLYRSIAIPACNAVQVYVEPCSEVLLADFNVYPAPQVPPGMLPPVFCRNDSIYASSAFYPGEYQVQSQITRFRDQTLISLYLQPFWFSPDSQSLRIFDSLRVKLTFEQPIGAVNADVGIFAGAAREMFINYSNDDGGIGNHDPGWRWCTPQNISSYYCDYLVITAGFVREISACRAKIGELAQHRADFNNFSVCLVNVEDIPNWQDWESVRNFIIDVYNDYSSIISSDGHLPFVLLVGDAWDDDGGGGGTVNDHLIPRTEYLPNPYDLNTLASDHYYAEMDPLNYYGPQIEDLAIGRIAIGDLEELTLMVNKIIQFETQPVPADFQNWKNNVMMQAGDTLYYYETNLPINENTAFTDLCNVIESSPYRNYNTFYQYWYDYPPCTVSADESFFYNQNGHSRYILDHWTAPLINGRYASPLNPEGAIAYFYIGHGTRNAELAWQYFVPDLQFPATEGAYDSLQNSSCLPLMVCVSCNTGEFDAQEVINWGWNPYDDWLHYDCFAEQYTHENPHGAIGVIAAVRLTYAYCSALQIKLAQRLFGLCAVPGDESWNDLIGWSFLSAKNALPIYINRQQYMLFGDPALNLFVEPTCGLITQNTVWAHRVDLVANTVVTSGATLTIQPGTTVIFHPGASLIICGRLNAYTISDPIVFRGTGVSSGSVKLYSGSSAQTTIRNCTFENLSYGLQLYATPNLQLSIEGNTFQDCNYGVNALHTGNALIKNRFINCQIAALRLEDYSGAVNYNRIEMGEDAYGIWARDCGSAVFNADTVVNAVDAVGDIGIFMQNSIGTVLDSLYLCGAEYSQLDCYRSLPVMANCKLINGAGRGMRLFGDSQPTMNLRNAGLNRIADNGGAEIYINGYLFPFISDGHNDFVDGSTPLVPLNLDSCLIGADFQPSSLPAGGYRTSARNNWYYGNGGPVLVPYLARMQILPGNSARFCVDVESLDSTSNTGYTLQALTPEDRFLEAVAWETDGEFSRAGDAFAQLIAEYPADPICVAAAYHYYQCSAAQQLDLRELGGYFSALSQDPTYADFQSTFNYLSAACWGAVGEVDQALAHFSNASTYPTATVRDSIYALIDAGALMTASSAETEQTFAFASFSYSPVLHREYELQVKTWLNALSAVDVAVSSEADALPQRFALHQNFPNPFNNSTMLLFDLPEDSWVELSIYNVCGQKVAALIDGRRTAGKHRVSWDLNRAVVTLSSGVYFCRCEVRSLATGSRSSALQKLLLLK